MFQSAQIFLALKKIMSGDDKDVRTLCLYTCKILAQLGYIYCICQVCGVSQKRKDQLHLRYFDISN